MGKPLIQALQQLTQACLDWQHHPIPFRTAKTVVLRKSGKARYDAAGSFRPVALLEVMSKVVEGVFAPRLQDMAEEHGMLPD
jgi:hypothetical protein